MSLGLAGKVAVFGHTRMPFLSCLDTAIFKASALARCTNRPVPRTAQNGRRVERGGFRTVAVSLRPKPPGILPRPVVRLRPRPTALVHRQCRRESETTSTFGPVGAGRTVWRGTGAVGVGRQPPCGYDRGGFRRRTGGTRRPVRSSERRVRRGDSINGGVAGEDRDSAFLSKSVPARPTHETPRERHPRPGPGRSPSGSESRSRRTRLQAAARCSRVRQAC